ncbi:hypothetical protein [Paenibacillus agricola]|uniref:Uncharacterized protein n=1 Tax=Paenibacillus agricola TaxID=2716264 RepID=A0ABX0JFK4_9BACL|nr:hypothetical protein [Paenibacillus agricola]NHN34688.1 hypothetical protein [Paenibacillus agricola]
MNKSLSIFDKYTGKENNVTKSLVDLFRFSDKALTKLFVIEFLKIDCDDMYTKLITSYDVQVGEKLIQKFGQGYVIGISTKKNNRLHDKQRNEKKINS